jgi:hypothetical protein
MQRTLAADAHVAEERFLLEEQTLNKAVSVIPNRISKTNSIQNRRTELRTNINLNKKECIEAMPPRT